MAPLYAHCPRCRFPAVINAAERDVHRRCRQCGGLYIPASLETEDETYLGPRGSSRPRNPRRWLGNRLKRGRL